MEVLQALVETRSVFQKQTVHVMQMFLQTLQQPHQEDNTASNPTTAATNQPQLPDAGTSWPTMLGTGFLVFL